jgi:hypothetical protein
MASRSMRQLRASAIAGVIVFGMASPRVGATIFVERWDQDSVGDTVDGAGAAGLENWERTFGTSSAGVIFSESGDKMLRLDPATTVPLGVTTRIAYPSDSVAGFLSIKANVRIESAGSGGAGNGYIFAAQNLDVTTGYLLGINAQTRQLTVERSIGGTATVLGAAFTVPLAFDFLISHSYEVRGTVVQPSEDLVIEVIVDGSLMFSRTDVSPISFTGGVKGGLLTTGGRSAVFDDFVAATAIPGDCSGDRLVTTADIPCFVATLLNPGAATSFEKSAADINEDLRTDGTDVPGFVDQIIP